MSKKEERIRRLPAEWEEQDGVLMAWPHERTDWAPRLDSVERVYVDIAREICRSERLVIVSPEAERVRESLLQAGLALDGIRIYELDTNDTWTRDFGPVTVMEEGRPLLLDFGFNGWGLKFAADLDNQITRRLARLGAFGDAPVETLGFILEGGSIESDGRGTILTTAQCLLSPNRNPHLDRGDIERVLEETLGADRTLWIESGYLAGDDTDSHVDTLARLCPGSSILYVACDDPEDEHYESLKSMEEELKGLRTLEGGPYRLVPLPWPDPCFDEAGRRVPATYANFLITNGAVLVPGYGGTKDAAAIETVRRVFPDRRVVGIDCLPLLMQHGSLHCVTMQIPKGALA